MGNSQIEMESSAQIDELTNVPEQEDPNSHKVINFKELFSDFQLNTEANIPFTNMHIEDVMFVDANHVVALEYIFYMKSDTAKYEALYNSKDITQDADKEDDSPRGSRPSNTSRLSNLAEDEIVNVFGDPCEILKNTGKDYLENFELHDHEVSND